ncbi:glucan biosynthesis protein G [Hydrogenophaga sp. PAMC20947]|uniref:glucan biosynthesis protein n=1 Tax=Hydrogenophaga sp. PAMC20947 TaxID=2565558 RepID=UPI00109DD8DC|nr:glucan biosynthesis protein G [Hydrogenophaga sp. PAMC20947]QCB48229.1 glucan biosynthesis protein G [Hydrogenophaga sp. PAMC20947]
MDARSPPIHHRQGSTVRWLCAALLVVALAPAALAAEPVRTASNAFDWQSLAQLAKTRAQAPWSEISDTLPTEVKNLNYDQLRDIRFKTEQSTWRQQALPFEVQYFHLGLNQKQPVRVHEIDALGQARFIPYSGDLFGFGQEFKHQRPDTQAWGDLGFAGLRLHYPLNNTAYKDELAVFLGASYFRMLGRDQQFGLSARGLAIDTVGAPAGQSEEFPRFTEFWLQRPAPDAKEVTLYALLESPRVTGAYQFVIRPGTEQSPESVATVRAQLHVRRGAPPINTLGVAPLTSMFVSGDNQPNARDYRPEVHDSDGLMLHTDGPHGPEWLWRPLQRPAADVLVNSFQAQQIRGFGLMQRDRNFDHYEDVEARYERRPSAWVVPLGDWGAGRVELVQLATPDETQDNVVAYWVPEKLPEPGQPLAFSYEVHWQGDQFQRPPGSWVTQSRRGYGYTQRSAAEQDAQPQYVLDFKGPALDSLPAGTELKAVVNTDGNGRVLEATTYPNPATRTWRMSLQVARVDPAKPVELRAFLQHQNQSVSEVWTHLLLPQ